MASRATGMTATANFQRVQRLSCDGVSLNSIGATPVQRLKAREKVLGSEKPRR